MTHTKALPWLRRALDAAAVPTLLAATFVLGCGESNAWTRDDDDPAGDRAPIVLEIAVDNPGVAVNSLQMVVEYDPNEVVLHQVVSQLPASMRLEFDPQLSRSGRFHLFAVPRGEARPESGAPPLMASFAVARLQFSARVGSQTPRDDAVRLVAPRFFGPLPDQTDHSDTVHARLKAVAAGDVVRE